MCDFSVLFSAIGLGVFLGNAVSFLVVGYLARGKK